VKLRVAFLISTEALASSCARLPLHGSGLAPGEALYQQERQKAVFDRGCAAFVTYNSPKPFFRGATPQFSIPKTGHRISGLRK